MSCAGRPRQCAKLLASAVGGSGRRGRAHRRRGHRRRRGVVSRAPEHSRDEMTTVPTRTAPLRLRQACWPRLPRLLRGDPVLAAVVGAGDATVAVPESAQAVVIAALAAFSRARTPARGHRNRARCRAHRRRPLLSHCGGRGRRGCAGSGCAGRRARPRAGVAAAPGGGAAGLGDAALRARQPRGRDDGAAAGHSRCVDRYEWSGSGTAGETRRVIVTPAPVRALLQRLGPLGSTAPVVVRPATSSSSMRSCPSWSHAGYRREHQVEHRGEFAVRGGIVDVFPSTADEPVRIDLWGDEVDRLTAFSDQRPALFGRPRRRRPLRMPRARPHRGAARPRPSALRSRRPWGASVWDRLAHGDQFDGMESWLPFLESTERVLPDLLPAAGQVLLVEPRRIRDRGAQLLDEEAALGRDAGRHVGGQGGRGGRLPAPARPLRAALARLPGPGHHDAGRPRRPGGPCARGAALRPGGGGPGAARRRGDAAGGRGVSRSRCAPPPAPVRLGWPRRSVTHGVHAPLLDVAPGTPGAAVVAAPITNGFILPGASRSRCSRRPTSPAGACRTAAPGRGRGRPTASSTTSRSAASSSIASTGSRASKA